MHTLDTEYNWDGYSNLIIEVCFNNATNMNGDATYYSNQPFTSTIYWYATNADSIGCELNRTLFYKPPPKYAL